MDSTDFRVLRTLRDWREAGRHAALVTVVRTWGSSPRPVGSLMAMCSDGTVVGSVSGGCIEDDIIYRYQGFEGWRRPERAVYGVDADEARQFGLPCGGTVELIIEFNPDFERLKQLTEATRGGQLVRRELCLQDGRVELVPIATPEPLSYTKDMLHSIFGPTYRLLIIGAGQLSEYLATMALFNGFRVTVCDPREEHNRLWSVDEAELKTGMPDDVVEAFQPDARSAVVALTHDPKLDDMALLSALHTDAFYVGAIGSRKNNAARRQRMIEYLDQPPALMEKLRGPVGVFIGSKTPAEIAVSIMAEIIAVKNGVGLPAHYQVEHQKDRIDVERTPA